MAKKMDNNTKIAITVGVLALVGLVVGVGVNQGWFKSSSTSGSDDKDENKNVVNNSYSFQTTNAQKANDWLNFGKNAADTGIALYGGLKGLFTTDKKASTTTSADGACYINDFGMLEIKNS